MTTQNTKPDFTGQHLFVGIDVSKNSWKVCILTQHVEHKTFTQPPKPEVLASYLQRHFPGAHYRCAYEAGYCGFWIHDQLQALGVDCIVVNPADVPTIHKEHSRPIASTHENWPGHEELVTTIHTLARSTHHAMPQRHASTQSTHPGAEVSSTDDR